MSKRVPLNVSPFLAVAIWLTFSVALAVWWVIFAYRLLRNLMIDPVISTELLIRKQKMLTYEGVSLVVLLLLGGLALSYYVWRESRRSQQMKEFFSSFSHDLRTPIASLRLQAESLSEDLKDSNLEKMADRIVKDTVRLELGLENSMLLSNIDDIDRLHIEEYSLQELVRNISQSWPDLKIRCDDDFILSSDRPGIEIVCKNIINNSVVHGRATEVNLSAEIVRDGIIRVNISDDGIGFEGSKEDLGRLFHRHTSKSGTGMGLHLVRSLMRKMHGRAEFLIDPKNKITVSLELRGKLK